MKKTTILFSVFIFVASRAEAITIYNDYKQIHLFINIAGAGECGVMPNHLYTVKARQQIVWPSMLPKLVCVTATTIPEGKQESKKTSFDNIPSENCHIAIKPSGHGPIIIPEFGCD